MKRLGFYRPRDPQSDAMGVMVPALLLTALGLLAVYSFGASFIAKQALWAIAGVAGCVLVSRAIQLDRPADRAGVCSFSRQSSGRVPVPSGAGDRSGSPR